MYASIVLIDDELQVDRRPGHLSVITNPGCSFTLKRRSPRKALPLTRQLTCRDRFSRVWESDTSHGRAEAVGPLSDVEYRQTMREMTQPLSAS
jgi:hypothetical protein